MSAFDIVCACIVAAAGVVILRCTYVVEREIRKQRALTRDLQKWEAR